MVREESTDYPLRETLGFIVSSRAVGSSDRKDGSVEYVSVCVCVCALACILRTQMQPMTLISLILALLAAMPQGNEVTRKVKTRLHGNTLADIRV